MKPIAQPEQQTEPVAWMLTQPGEDQYIDHTCTLETAVEMQKRGWKAVPLYAAPQVAQPKDKPIFTEKTDAYICQGCGGIYWSEVNCDCNTKAAFDMVLVSPIAQPDQTTIKYTYASTQETNCAGCGILKHTPLRVDKMEGYVCLTCIDKMLESLLDAAIAQPEQPTSGEYAMGYAEGFNGACAKPAQPEQQTLPSCYSDDAVAFIEKHLALRNYPANSHNAARAGWDAAYDLLANIAQPEQPAEPVAWAIFAGNGNMRLWSRKESYVQSLGDELGLPLVALYTHPTAQPKATT